MKFQRLSPLAAALVVWGCGCDEPKGAHSPPTGQQTQAVPAAPRLADAIADPAPRPAAAMAAPLPTTRPAAVAISSFRIFDSQAGGYGVLYEFPRARLHLNPSDNTAILYSDDPKAAIKPGYSGNSYYMVIPLNKDQPQKLDDYQWQFRSASIDEHQDTNEGIFLEGQRFHLAPSDVTIAFQGEGPSVKVAVIGTFAKFDNGAKEVDRMGVPVGVKGIIEAIVDTDK